MGEPIGEGCARWVAVDSWEPLRTFGRGWDARPAPVPLWEKQFCSQACGFPWKRLCALQRFLGCETYEGIYRWDDSAAAEALRNAKARFCAAYHGRRCNIPLPDPDMFIDEVDYDAVIDPELVADLEKPPPDYSSDVVDSGTKKDKTLSGLEMLHPNWNDHLLQEIKPTGWEDAEEPLPSNQQGKVGGDDAWNCSGLGAARDQPWGSGELDTCWDRGRSVQCVTWEGNDRNCERGRSYVNVQWGCWDKDRNFQHGRRNGMIRDAGGTRWSPRYAKPKYQRDAYQSNDYHLRDCRGGRGRNWTGNIFYEDSRGNFH